MQKGDIVLLKSGSPLMTIKKVVSGSCLCYYWNPYLHQFGEATFSEEMLVDANSRYTPIFYSEEVKSADKFHKREF